MGIADPVTVTPTPASLSVLAPKITSVAFGVRLMRVPETVMAGPPGTSVWPAMIYCEAASGVMTELPIESKGRRVANIGPDVSGSVLLPMTRPDAEGAREMRVPDMVIAGAPGISVWLSMRYWEAVLGSIVIPSMASGGSWVALATRGIVVPPMTMPDADGARLIGCVNPGLRTRLEISVSKVGISPWIVEVVVRLAELSITTRSV